MGQKLKIAGWISVGALAGVMTTVSLQSVAQRSLAVAAVAALERPALSARGGAVAAARTALCAIGNGLH